MDIIKEIEKLKDTKLKLEARKKVIQTLKEHDEELYFEEETIDLAGKKYLSERLIKKNNAYFTKAVPIEVPFCVICWEDLKQLNAIKKTNKEGVYLCLVCDLKK
ncbi:MAG TPA: hypothetical protein VK338_02260 [Candidatus Nitrosocosmicus sp.]|nr:hypothetical protein [Candidatus Nitrosocosmicus sp.]